MSKKCRDLVSFIESNDFAYQQLNKDALKRKGKAAFKELGKLLGLRKIDVDYNPGGIGVGGELRLIGTWEEGKGIYILLSPNGPLSSDIMYRGVKHMKDFGGSTHNHWTPLSSLGETDTLINKINQLKGRL